MRKSFVITAVLLIFIIGSQVVQAGTFYKHDHESYWWYVVDKPAFSAIIPSDVSGAENYLRRSIFGMEILEITFKDNSVSMELIHQPGKDVKAIRASLEARYKPLVKDVSVIADREITTSNNLKAYFWAYEATGLNDQKVMLRSVFFQKDENVVYLVMFMPADKFEGDLREYWIRAVNGFEWN